MSTQAPDPTVDLITIDGVTYFELKVEDPDGQGFLVERVPTEKDDEPLSRKEIEARIEEATGRLKDRHNQKSHAGGEARIDDLQEIANLY